MNRSDLISVPIEIVNSKEVNIVGEENAQIDLVEATFNPDEITFYRADPANEDNAIDRTCISFKNGETLSAVLTIVEFEKLLFKR